MKFNCRSWKVIESKNYVLDPLLHMSKQGQREIETSN